MTTNRANTPQARGRANKQRAKNYERDVARILGGTRHLADSGGPEDIRHEEYAIQVKSGATVTTGAMRDGLQAARVAAVGRNVLPCVVLVDRRGTRLVRYIVFGLEEYADWNGLGGQQEETDDDDD